MKNRVKNLEIVSGKVRADCAAGAGTDFLFSPKQSPAIILKRSDTLKIEGMKACKGLSPQGITDAKQWRAALRAIIEDNNIEPIGVFRDGKLWHVLEFLDEDNGDYCQWSGVEGALPVLNAAEITFGPVPGGEV